MKNAKRRSLWHFTCKSCGTENHQTLIRKRAVKGLCLVCLKIDPRQITMFGVDMGYGEDTNSLIMIRDGKILNLQGNKIAGETRKNVISL